MRNDRPGFSRVLVAAVLTAGCGSTSTVGTSNLLTGTYEAEIFLVTPQGQPQVDVLLAGGSLRITIDKDGNTTGSLSIPAGVPGGPLTASMAGTANITALTVQFDQSAVTFVRDLVWERLGGTTLRVFDAPAANATYRITMIRQL